MGTQFNLPPELRGVADHLRGVPLPESRVNRDQLFYEAGLAAATASAFRRQLLPWQMASSLLAASALVLAVMLVQSPTEDLVVAKSDSTQSAAKAAAATNSTMVRTPIRRPIRFWPESASLLALRDAALRMDLPEPDLMASSNGEGRKSRSRTARELLREMLPKNVASGSAGG